MNNQTALKTAGAISELRTKRGVTQDEVAVAIGVSNKTVSKWETAVAVPEAEYIPLLADYFGVTTDEIFGRVGSKISASFMIEREYESLSTPASVKKSFSLAHDVIRNCTIRSFKNNLIDESYVPEHIVSSNKDTHRVVLSDNNAFEIVVNRDAVNMAVMLLDNNDNFSWLKTNADEFRPLFELLADPDGITLARLIHTRAFPERFTADFFGRHADISIEKAEQLLDKAVKLKLCESLTAHLKEGTTKLYTAYGNGMVLSIITLAFEYVCGLSRNEICLGGAVKMIRGSHDKNR